MNIYLSSAYLPPVVYYARFQRGNRIYIEQNENYQKQSYRNRCLILSANGAMPLSIPVEHNSGDKIPVRDIRIASHGNWQHLHWNAIVSAYNSSPFFEYYADDFAPFYHRKYTYLFDFNCQLLDLTLNLLGLDYRDYTLGYTSQYIVSLGDDDRDYRDLIHPKRNWQPFIPDFRQISYYQVFGQRYGFTGNMSIIDLLFNMGNESLLVLADSQIPRK